MWRVITLFDTSAIPDTDTIDSATLSLYLGTDKLDQLSTGGSIGIVDAAPASNTAIATGDFATMGSTLQASTVTIASVGTNAYKDFALNATGLSNISKTGISKFGVREEADRSNTEPTAQTNGAKYRYVNWFSADTSGTTSDPKLVVVHSAAAASGVGLTLNKGWWG